MLDGSIELFRCWVPKIPNVQLQGLLTSVSADVARVSKCSRLSMNRKTVASESMPR